MMAPPLVPLTTWMCSYKPASMSPRMWPPWYIVTAPPPDKHNAVTPTVLLTCRRTALFVYRYTLRRRNLLQRRTDLVQAASTSRFVRNGDRAGYHCRSSIQMVSFDAARQSKAQGLNPSRDDASLAAAKSSSLALKEPRRACRSRRRPVVLAYSDAFFYSCQLSAVCSLT